MRLAKFFRIVGTILVVLVLLICAPMVVPKLMGMQVLEVVSGSMQPELPINCVVYVEKCDANVIEVGDIISFYVGTDEENIISHRVVDIDEQQKFFYTKGDANSNIDDNPVAYSHVIGKIKYKINNLAWLARMFDTVTGLLIIGGLILIACVMYIASDIIAREKLKINKEIFIVGIAIIMIVVAAVNIYTILSDYHKSNELYTKLNQEFTITNEENVSDDEKWYDMIQVDIPKLISQNNDTVGWIFFENDDISYPIMQTDNNEFYLHKSFDKEYAAAGSIFLESYNSSDFNDYHSIVYGHNMRNLSMFGKLKNYNRDENYYESNKYFQIFVGDKVYRYEIFAYETVKEESDIYQVPFYGDEEFEKFITYIKSISLLDSGIEVGKENKIVTLSTCSTSGSSNRFVVHGLRVDEHSFK